MATQKKKIFPAMMPIKKWLSLPEACAYMDMSVATLATQNLTVSAIGKKIYYMVNELDNLIQKNIIKQAV